MRAGDGDGDNELPREDVCESKVEIVTPYWASNSNGKVPQLYKDDQSYKRRHSIFLRSVTSWGVQQETDNHIKTQGKNWEYSGYLSIDEQTC